MSVGIELPGGCPPIPSQIWGGAPDELYAITYMQMSGEISSADAWAMICELPRQEGPEKPVTNEDIEYMVSNGHLALARRILDNSLYELPFIHWELLPPPKTERLG